MTRPNEDFVEKSANGEPHDVKLARETLAKIKRDPGAEDSIARILAAAVVHYYERRAKI